MLSGDLLTDNFDLLFTCFYALGFDDVELSVVFCFLQQIYVLFGFDRELLRESLSGDILTHDKFGILFTCSFPLLCSDWLWWCWSIPRFLFFCCWSFSIIKLEQRPSRRSLNWCWFLFYIILFVRFFCGFSFRWLWYFSIAFWNWHFKIWCYIFTWF